jgi:hypothetical protein
MQVDSGEITKKMQPCNRIYYSTVHWRLNMFQAAHRSSSGALTLFAVSGLHTHVVTGRSQVWVGTGQFPLRIDYGRSPHAYVNERLQIRLGLLMMGGMPLETCWAFNERWNNRLYYKVASCWLFQLSLLWMFLYWQIYFACLALTNLAFICPCIASTCILNRWMVNAESYKSSTL